VKFVENLLFRQDDSGLDRLPALVDADGLNNLARIDGWPERREGPMVLTPHPGEMATLTGLSTTDIQQDRVAVAREYAAKWNVCLVLKGANTVIGRPGGTVSVAAFANPGMASGAPAIAASCGVYVHGEAGRETVARLGNTGTAASDLLLEIPAAIHRLRAV